MSMPINRLEIVRYELSYDVPTPIYNNLAEATGLFKIEPSDGYLPDQPVQIDDIRRLIRHALQDLTDFDTSEPLT